MIQLDNEDIIRLEQAYGFPLQSWQKEFLKGNDIMVPRGSNTRQVTFIQAVNLLLTSENTFTINDMIFAISDTGMFDESYVKWFTDFMIDINSKMVSAGIPTKLIKGGNDVV